MPDLHLSLNLKQSNVGGGSAPRSLYYYYCYAKAYCQDTAAYYDMPLGYSLTGHRILMKSLWRKYSLKIFISSFPVLKMLS